LDEWLPTRINAIADYFRGTEAKGSRDKGMALEMDAKPLSHPSAKGYVSIVSSNVSFLAPRPTHAFKISVDVPEA
jgi:hypothetical protein